MKRSYSAWARPGLEFPECLAEGTEPPRGLDGTPMPNCEVLLWTIEAGSFEEAMAIRNLRCGWEPYRPQGEAAPCPACGALHYPEGSGQCWRCGRQG